jgi:hypothetical protein
MKAQEKHARMLQEVNDAKYKFMSNTGYPIRIDKDTWRHMLKKNQDTVLMDGKKRQIKARSIGAGVYELSLKEKK